MMQWSTVQLRTLVHCMALHHDMMYTQQVEHHERCLATGMLLVLFDAIHGLQL